MGRIPGTTISTNLARDLEPQGQDPTLDGTFLQTQTPTTWVELELEQETNPHLQDGISLPILTLVVLAISPHRLDGIFPQLKRLQTLGLERTLVANLPRLLQGHLPAVRDPLGGAGVEF